MPADLETSWILLGAGNAAPAAPGCHRSFVIGKNASRKRHVGFFVKPDLGINLGKWYVTESALQMLVKDPGFDTGGRKHSPYEMRLLQIRSGIELLHARSPVRWGKKIEHCSGYCTISAL